MLEAQGKADVQAGIGDRAREILSEANEASDGGFAVTSAYVVATARRPPARPRPR
jgi:hypothetical protein